MEEAQGGTAGVGGRVRYGAYRQRGTGGLSSDVLGPARVGTDRAGRLSLQARDGTRGRTTLQSNDSRTYQCFNSTALTVCVTVPSMFLNVGDKESIPINRSLDITTTFVHRTVLHRFKGADMTCSKVASCKTSVQL